MNLFIKIILVFTFIGFTYSQDCNSKLIIETDLQLVNIFINDSLVSDSSFYETELKSGSYEIIVMENSDRWDAKTFVDSIELNNCKTKKLSYFSNRKVYLDTNPQDAFVFDNDSLIGSTPLFIGNISNELKLTKPGYKEKMVLQNSFSENMLVNLEFIGEKKEKSFFYSTTFQILAGTAIALGAVTAYYKLKADDKFDEYQFTGNQDLLDETNKYDLISGITFAALQINFGFMLYKFLTE